MLKAVNLMQTFFMLDKAEYSKNSNIDKYLYKILI